jgi:hypothetical protein
MGSHKCAPVSYAATAQPERLPLSSQVAATPEGFDDQRRRKSYAIRRLLFRMNF